MTKSPSNSSPNCNKIRFIPLAYNSDESQASAFRLIFTLRPEWKDGKVELIQFTDGTTNTLLKVTNKVPGLSPEEIDNEAILLRAYGPGTEIFIDREQEAHNHKLLMQYSLAPELLARFQNGMLYRFLRGSVTAPPDLRKQEIWRAVARRMAEWHALVPCSQTCKEKLSIEKNGGEYTSASSPTLSVSPDLHSTIAKPFLEMPTPNLWTVLQKWISALPKDTLIEKKRQEIFQREKDRLFSELCIKPGFNSNSKKLVFAHCDLLSGNIVLLPPSPIDDNTKMIVSFIDFEFATSAPAAFDIANHFSEWGGFDCEYHHLPTRSQRIDFIREYIKSYYKNLNKEISIEDEEAKSKQLFSEVDTFRGLPGLYWGVWALIQSKISKIDFDYASYAEIRLSEYWDWRAENDRSCSTSGGQISVREARWAEE